MIATLIAWYNPEKLNLRTGTGWRVCFRIFCGPPGPYDF